MFKKIVLWLIELLERFEYRNLDLDQDDVDKKIMDSLDLSGYEISTDTGNQKISQVHKTQPYDIWRLELANGYWLECADKHIVFYDNFVEVFVRDLFVGDYVMTDDGLKMVVDVRKIGRKVSMFDVSVEDENHRYWSNGILSHNTICSSIFIAHYLLFNVDRNVLILSNKGTTTREIVDKSKTILENLPFFMKPGVLKNDVFNMKFDNGCRLIGQATTKNAGIGFTIHLLFLDEFAHIHANFVDAFFENVYPTLSSSKVSKIIITSTPNGFNKFYEIYNAAVEGENDFKAFRVDWWQIPGRDEVWMRKEIANLGGEEAFNRQYGNQFISSSNLLLGPADIKNIKEKEQTFVSSQFDELEDLGIDYLKFFEFEPDFDVLEIQDEENYYVFSVDVAEGNGGDSSIINIFKVEVMPFDDMKYLRQPGTFHDFFRLRQVGVFKSNEHSMDDFAKMLYTIAFEIFDPENVKIVLEWNTYGSELLKRLQTVFPHKNEFDEEIIVKFKHRNDAKILKYGLRIKSDNKSIFCQNFKNVFQQKKIIITEKKNVYEAITFGKGHDGSYKGQKGNDDLMMSCINACEYFNTIDYSDTCEEIYEFLEESGSPIPDQIDILLERYVEKGVEGNLYFDIYDLLGQGPSKELNF